VTKVETLGFKNRGVVVRIPISEVKFNRGDAEFRYGGRDFFVPDGTIWTLISDTVKPRMHHIIYEDVNQFVIEKEG